MTDKQFPLVSDDEIMLTEMPHMNLYDELDLISNITGDYTDRNYLEWMPIVDSSRHAPIAASQAIRRPPQAESFRQLLMRKDRSQLPLFRRTHQANLRSLATGFSRITIFWQIFSLSIALSRRIRKKSLRRTIMIF